jgi:hypothetical protein
MMDNQKCTAIPTYTPGQRADNNKAAVRQWLDLQISANRQRDLAFSGIPGDMRRGCRNISFSNDDIHLFDVRPLAHLLGLEIEITREDSAEFPITIECDYQGVRLFSIHTYDEVSEAIKKGGCKK